MQTIVVEEIGFHPKSLCIDLETSVETEAVIYKIAAWRADTEQSEVFKGRFQTAEVTPKLDMLTVGASFLLGHNVVEHDLRLLKRNYPDLALLTLPVIDTLQLSPIAFPQNPYHSLIKDYKLVRDSINDPLKDAQLSFKLFNDQRDALNALNVSAPDELVCYYFLMTSAEGNGLSSLFRSILHAARPELDLVKELYKSAVQGKVCNTRLEKLVQEDINNVTLHMPLAYALAWLRVSGGNSVLPPWVGMQFPETKVLLKELRDQRCNQADCAYCNTVHDPISELKRYFGFDEFRAEPANLQGGSLQEDIVSTGMRAEHLLAILPTGGGKSLCYQLPALNRYWRNGSLTVIISPLQSLMKDQVDNLVKQGLFCGAALNGMLSVPERRDVLEKVRLGDIGILLVSPEQLRNKSFIDAIRHREIGAWVFDEAHCLSKWGQDFRPDYIYASRFIKEHIRDELPQIACFTATAKVEVIEDLRAHFKEILGVELKLFAGGHERNNLHYEVINTTSHEKFGLIHKILGAELNDFEGGAIVFAAKRKSAEDISAFLKEMGWNCAFFHAGLQPDEKNDVQQNFISGGLRVIVATNAFGMGVDKPDVRAVIHAEIPGSLENYLQEAGRAGRDRNQSRCILLYDEEDVEVQFGLAARSRLSRKDIGEILRSLRKRSNKAKDNKIVITSGEILADEDQDSEIDAESRDAETRVKTAVSWLERARLLQRNENETRVFPASLKIGSLQLAGEKLKAANLTVDNQAKYLKIVQLLINADATDGISTDELMLQTGMHSDECMRVLQQMELLGILSNDIGITVRLRKGIANSSQDRFVQIATIEQALLDLLAERTPDSEANEWQELNLRNLCQGVKDRIGAEVITDDLLSLLRAMSQPFGNTQAERPSFEIKKITRDHFRVKLRRSWQQIREISDKRRAISQVLLSFFLGKLPAETRGADLLVESTAGKLCEVLREDLGMIGQIRDEAKALEQGLMYLDRIKSIHLDRGRTVFRSAMTIHVFADEAKRGFRQSDYVGLQEYYEERNFQIHVVQEYARLGLEKLNDAMVFIAAYFRWSKSDFIKRYFASRKELLELATTGESLNRIVDNLKHPLQQSLVADKSDTNRLILAGPGSGKTRVIVHRVAYLLRVLRTPADGIIVLTFNRLAAFEVRKRLIDLVGQDAYGVTVLTYHAMAMRLTGTSLRGMAEKNDTPNFDEIIRNAINLLQGNGRLGEDDSDELRDKLLQGYRYILVDEYQDIDADQYDLISALTGRVQADRDSKLTIMAVGDDDQNIYEFRKTSNEFIKRFQEDYQAKIEYLIENYRSSSHIIAAANQIISDNPERLKQEHPIRINFRRQTDFYGGRWEKLDSLVKGRVHVVRCSSDANIQAQMAMAEVRRLFELLPSANWGDFAILARSHKLLTPIRAYCELNGIPCVQIENGRTAENLKLNQLREGQLLIRLLLNSRRKLVAKRTLVRWINNHVAKQPANHWLKLLQQCIEEFCVAWSMDEIPSSQLLEWIFEFSNEQRSSIAGKLTISTVHASKGREFNHVIVLDGDWLSQSTPEERRLYYVGMTRAKQTLTLFEFFDSPNPFSITIRNQRYALLSDLGFYPQADPALDIKFIELGLADVDMDFAGRLPADAAIHRAIASLVVGAELRLTGRELQTMAGIVVGRLSKNCSISEVDVISISVFAIASRHEEAVSDAGWRDRLKVKSWETILCLIKKR
ncbi:RecQ family ATP-dependent DNA helicase [Gallionella capsiferriformans]|uniref:DNA 3'-5' helicase n=1 Tax=Gallionella capsiferriformans (strain ES-2) TaxID=395494 RepID=D9SG06_GALCS|nr:RecQ family ATP-dependent DNA helicase [Gallionella capsiferriformans]ADL55453.1 ATP-dependent DNA helicase, RecQ family [Gallionella capsiferriformans ES-2]